MKKKYLWIIFCCMTILILTSSESMAIAKSNKRNKKVIQVQLLYVQTAMSGSLEETSSGQLLLTLEGVLPATIWFANRPQRLTGSEPTDGFVEHSWNASGFNEDPPNAALEAEFEDGTRSVITLELESPEYDSTNNKITYMAMLFDGEPTEALTHLHENSNSELSGSFQHAVLFIDDAGFKVINGCILKTFTTCALFDLSGANMKNLDLTGANFRDSNLTGVNLRGANLSSTYFYNTNLTSAILTGANLYGGNLTNTNLTSTNLTNVNLDTVLLDGANLTSANFDGATIKNISLSGATLKYVDLSGVDLHNTSFHGANLSNAALENAILTLTDFENANLSNADLAGADFTRASLIGANLTGADLTGATLTDADLTNATWTDGTKCGTGHCDGKAY